MKNSYAMKGGLLTLLLCVYSYSLVCQSISGNVLSGKYKKNLGYANVNIYKNGKLVANVLSNDEGNFYVKLDTGMYQCEINYAGYKKIKKEIRVTTDEKADFSLAEDASSKYSAEEVDAISEKSVKYAEHSPSAITVTGGSSSYSHGALGGSLDSYAYDWIGDAIERGGIKAMNLWGEIVENDSASYGKLTAGEINDFGKWKLWTDLSEGELKLSREFWNLSPEGRFTVQVKDENDLPLANAKVELFSKGTVIYTATSDNTGKAELWSTLDGAASNQATEIRVTYNGESKPMQPAMPFEKGMNIFTFNAPCKQPENVDIAIVVDATGSMQDEIDYLKFDLNNVIFKAKEFSSKLNLRFANIFYRDHEDTYLTKTQDFTDVLSESVAFTNREWADGGGDTEEAVEVALDSAINRLSWRKDTRAKILLLVLDAPPHRTPEIREKMKTLCYQAAQKGIRIVPVTGSGADKNTEYLMRCIALATNGTYLFLSNHSGIGGAHIEPSTDSYQVEILNDLLVRVIKAYTYMPDCRQAVADLGVNLPDSVVVVQNEIDSTAVSKSDTVKTNNAGDAVQLEWNFYPNPTDGIIHIVANKEIKELYITDLSGKVLQVIREIRAGVAATADLGDYASGIYLIRYPVGKHWVSGKIMLARG